MSKEKLIPELRFPDFKNEGKWEEKALRSVSNVIMGSSPKSSAYNENKIGLPLLQGNADIKNRLSCPRIYTSEITKECQIGDILLSVRAPVGTVAKSIHKACIGRGISAIRAKNQNLQEYLYQWLFSFESYWKNISQGGTFDAVNSDDIKNLLIPIPKLEEQKKIASCFSSLDELITSHKDKLEALKDHKKGLLQNLFPSATEGERNRTPKYRFPEFEKDGEWVEKKLGDVAEIKRGKSKHRPRNASFLYGGKYPFIQTGDIREAGVYLSEFNQTYSEAGLKQSKLWNENTLCVTIAANIAETTILKIKACFPDSVIGIVPKAEMTTVVFLHYQFEIFKTMVQGQAQGVAQANLNQKKLSEIEFTFPPTKEEQQKIASCLSAVDELITAQAQKIEQLQEHKKGLMQGLFPKVNS